MDYATLKANAEDRHLSLAGAFHPGADDKAPDGTGTLILLAPREPGFWAHFTASMEYNDGAPDPMDRWSTRVVTELAETDVAAAARD